MGLMSCKKLYATHSNMRKLMGFLAKDQSRSLICLRTMAKDIKYTNPSKAIPAGNAANLLINWMRKAMTKVIAIPNCSLRKTQTIAGIAIIPPRIIAPILSPDTAVTKAKTVANPITKPYPSGLLNFSSNMFLYNCCLMVFMELVSMGIFIQVSDNQNLFFFKRTIF